MIYLDYFIFPHNGMEFDFFSNIQRTCYDSFYPFKILSERGLNRIDFESVTILHGGNGSGKTTLTSYLTERGRIKSAIINPDGIAFKEFGDYSFHVKAA